MFEAVLKSLRPFAQEFTRQGKQVYLVGGAVRNLLLGRAVKDFDFTTNALPSEVQTYFPKVLPTGLQHGTVTVLFRGLPYEVTTFRVDGTYSDQRRPDVVTFTPNLEEDLKRRDFTINAIALNLETGQLFDPEGGRNDLEGGLLRAIGNPGTRFDEDALRILRLFRFAAQLGFRIDDATLAAVPPRRPSLGAVSRERVREELMKLLQGAYPARAWGQLAELGILGDLFASLSPRPLTEAELGELAVLAPDLRWSFWLTISTSCETSQWERALRLLTFSNAQVAAALGPAQAWDLLRTPSSVSVGAKAVIERWGSRERVTPGVEYLRALERVGYWQDNEGWCKEILKASSSGDPIFLGELAVNGRDLLDEGVPPGPNIGRVLQQLQREVWLDREMNSSERLRSRGRELQK